MSGFQRQYLDIGLKLAYKVYAVYRMQTPAEFMFCQVVQETAPISARQSE